MTLTFTSTRVLDFIGDSEKQFQSKDERKTESHRFKRKLEEEQNLQ